MNGTLAGCTVGVEPYCASFPVSGWNSAGAYPFSLLRAAARCGGSYGLGCGAAADVAGEGEGESAGWPCCGDTTRPRGSFVCRPIEEDMANELVGGAGRAVCAWAGRGAASGGSDGRTALEECEGGAGGTVGARSAGEECENEFLWTPPRRFRFPPEEDALGAAEPGTPTELV